MTVGALCAKELKRHLLMTTAGRVARNEKWQVSILVSTLFAHDKERHVSMKGTQPPTRLTNGALATATQQGPEERTGPAGNAHCLTLLSEPTSKLQPHKRRPHNGAHRCGAKHIWSSKCAKHFSVGRLLEVAMSKSARHCGAKRILRSKCVKHLSVRRLLEVSTSKKFTPLWLEAHLEVKC